MTFVFRDCRTVQEDAKKPMRFFELPKSITTRRKQLNEIHQSSLSHEDKAHPHRVVRKSAGAVSISVKLVDALAVDVLLCAYVDITIANNKQTAEAAVQHIVQTLQKSQL